MRMAFSFPFRGVTVSQPDRPDLQSGKPGPNAKAPRWAKPPHGCKSHPRDLWDWICGTWNFSVMNENTLTRRDVNTWISMNIKVTRLTPI